MPTLNEQKYAALGLQGYTGTLNEREYAWLQDQCGGGGGPSSLLTSNIGWWTLGEATGAARVDSSVSGYDLPDILTDVSQVAGKVGMASSTLYQTSSRLQISAAAAPLLQPGDIDYTIAGWIRHDGVGDNAAAFSNYNLVNSGHTLWIPPGQTALHYSVAGTDLITFVPTLTTWYFFVCAHDAAGDLISVKYDDTTLFSVAHVGGIASGVNAFNLHSYGAGAFSLGCSLDEIGVWNRLLTPAEQTELYNGGAGVTYADLL